MAKRNRFVAPDTVRLYLDEGVLKHKINQAQATADALPETKRAALVKEIAGLRAELRTAEARRNEQDWIEVKSRLTFEEGENLRAQALTSGNILAGNVGASLNMARFKLARFEAWIVDWSFCDGDDRAVDVSPVSIATLDEDTAGEIEATLDAYVTAQAAERANPTGRTGPGEKSP